MYIFRGRGVFIDVYKADDKTATSGTTSLADINLRRTYRAIDSGATGRIPSLFCASTFSQVRNLYGFFSLGLTDGYPTLLSTLQGFYNVAQEHSKVGCPSKHHH